jgi:hypothetical protein
MYVIQRGACFISYVCKARPYGNHLALLVGVRKKEGRGLAIFTEGRRGFLREKRLEERRVLKPSEMRAGPIIACTRKEVPFNAFSA